MDGSVHQLVHEHPPLYNIHVLLGKMFATITIQIHLPTSRFEPEAMETTVGLLGVVEGYLLFLV